MELFAAKKLTLLHGVLARKNETIAVAESVTSGLLQLALGQAENAADFYQGGITVYNLGQKYRHLQVEPIHANKVNCISGKVSEQMALNVCKLFQSDWGIGITGYATPVPESGGKVFAYYAIGCQNKIIKAAKITPSAKSPFEVQLFYVKGILNQLVKILT